MLSDDDSDEKGDDADIESSRQLKRLFEDSSTDPDDTNDRHRSPRLTQARIKRRATMRSWRSDVMPRLDASQPEPPSTTISASKHSSQETVVSATPSQSTIPSPLSTTVPTLVAHRRSARLSAGGGRANRQTQ